VIRSKKRGVTESAKAANGGLAYADELQQRFSAIRFVFITGWLDSSRLEAATRRGTLLLKPFTGDTLLATIALM